MSKPITVVLTVVLAFCATVAAEPPSFQPYGAWRGRVYNPEDGGTYRTEVRPRAGGALEVKGCVAFICRTRVWSAAS